MCCTCTCPTTGYSCRMPYCCSTGCLSLRCSRGADTGTWGAKSTFTVVVFGYGVGAALPQHYSRTHRQQRCTWHPIPVSALRLYRKERRSRTTTVGHTTMVPGRDRTRMGSILKAIAQSTNRQHRRPPRCGLCDATPRTLPAKRTTCSGIQPNVSQEGRFCYV